ncbi:MAG: hypothetical protein JXA77_07050 [Bacteroidales bacterium]|nr:hypothetical protein [Bacteroidales bacterium]MBN2819632.1 hypothetical protein [Bacteroidales bacterium]
MKKLLKFLLYFVLFILIVLFTAPILFKGKIMSVANEQINNNINARAGFDDIKISFFKQFPYLSVSLKNLSVVGVEEFDGDTLLYVESVDLAVNVISAIKMENIEVKKIGITGPVINGIIREDGTANWDIAIPSEEPETEVEDDTTATEFNAKIMLKTFYISNAYISYSDYESGMKAKIDNFNFNLSGDFSKDFSALLIDSDAEKMNFYMDGIKYLNEVALNIHMNIDANLKDMIFILQENTFALNELVLKLNGSFEMPESENMKFDMAYATNNADFKTLLSLVPAVYMNDFAELKAAGKMSLSGKINGELGEVETPNVTGDLKVENASFSYPDLPKSAENIQVDIEYFYDGKQMNNTTLDVNKFHIELGQNPIDISLNLKTPISDPFINSQINVNIDLATISDIIPLEDTQIKGKIVSKLDLMGNASVIENEKYEDFKAVGTILIQDLYYNSPDVPQPVSISVADVEFSPKYLDVKLFKTKIGASDIALNGKITDFIPFVLKDETIHGTLNLNSGLIDLNEFMSGEPTEELEEMETDSASALEVIEVPKNIDFTLNSSIDKLYYDKLVMEDVLGEIIIRDGAVKLNKLKVNTLDGNITISGEYNTQDMKNLLVDFNIQANSIDIPKTFAALDLLGKIAPIASKATGKISLGMNISSFLQHDMKPVLKSIIGGGNLSSDKIGISGSNAFTAISKSLNSDALKNLVLNDINLEYALSEGKLLVKPFETKMGNTQLNIQGEQGFDNTLDYDINIMAPKSLFGSSNSAISNLYSNSAVPGLNFSAVDNVNLLVKLTGDMLNPKVKIDPKASAKSVTESVKENIKTNTKEVIDTKKEDAKAKAREEADKILAAAEKQAAEVRKQGKIAADKIRTEADANADKLVKQASNPIAKKAAEVSAEKIRSEGEKRAQQVEKEADLKAQKILDEAQKKADNLLN